MSETEEQLPWDEEDEARVNGERNEIKRLRAEVTRLQSELKQRKAEQFAAVEEMAKARRKAADAESARDVDRLIGMERGEESQGAFQRLYLKAQQLEDELKRLKAERRDFMARTLGACRVLRTVLDAAGLHMGVEAADEFIREHEEMTRKFEQR